MNRIRIHGIMRGPLLPFILLLSAIFAPPAVGDDRPSAASLLIAQPRVLVIGHRGASLIAPENTLPAFRAAAEAGADLVELDYRHSADGMTVVIHDEHLGRTTDAVFLWGREKILVETKTIDQLKLLDAGSWFDREFAGTRIPTLAESLATIQPDSMTLIERKTGDAGTCIDLLRERKLLKRVVVQAFDWKYLSECRRLSPDLTLAALGSKELTAEQLDEIQATGAAVVAWSHKDLNATDIAHIHARKLRCWVYTVNDIARARQLIEWHVDGIITDAPARIRRLVGSRKAPSRPAERVGQN